MDPITDIFTAMHVDSVVYGRIDLTAPWALRFEQGEYACFGTVAAGSGWLTVQGLHQPISLAAGDCFCLFAQANVHTLGDHPETRPSDMQDVVRTKCGNSIRFGGGGVPATIIGGKFTFDRPNSRPLTDLLPPFILVANDRAQGLPLHQTLQLFAAEATQCSLGSDVVLKRLADIFLLQMIREHVSSNSCRQTGWLRALADPRIGSAVRSMHQKIEQSWTVAELASAAGMSRSAFALRFRQIVGETPLDYLTQWRIYKAAVLLRDGGKKLTEVANAVGYDSGAAFNKIFKRIVGVTPGEYRRAGNGLPVNLETVASIDPERLGTGSLPADLDAVRD